MGKRGIAEKSGSGPKLPPLTQALHKETVQCPTHAPTALAQSWCALVPSVRWRESRTIAGIAEPPARLLPFGRMPPRLARQSSRD